jgi:hypothetical protein
MKDPGPEMTKVLTGLPDPSEVPEGTEPSAHKRECEIVRNNWHMRVARYFAWAVDGGMMGSRFDLGIMIAGFSYLDEGHCKTAQAVLGFLLHMRPRDMTKTYDDQSILNHLKTGKFNNTLPYDKPGFTDCLTFNESVMMALLRSDYIKKTLYGDSKKEQYYRTLGKFLTQGCGTDLKAYVCKVFMETGGKGMTEEILGIMISPLVYLLSDGGAFLATYASAALVNLCSGNEAIKTKLMSAGIPLIACQQLKAKDDDLVCYVLMLLVNLTKEPHHRSILNEQGVIVQLYDILTSTYHQSASASSGASVLPGSNTIKVKILTQVCIIIGQFSNEPAYRKKFQKMFEHTIACLVYIYMETKKATPLSCKALFAIKQVCVDNNGQKMYVCSHVARKLVEELLDEKLEKTVDFYNQAVLLLQALANHRECPSRLNSAGLTTLALDKLQRGKREIRNDKSLSERIENLKNTMELAVERFGNDDF